MYKTLLKLIAELPFIIITILLFLLPFNMHIFGLSCNIFPALDLIIIYYLTVQKKLYNRHLFFIGIFLDGLYIVPLGIHSFILISANIILEYLRRYFAVKGYQTDLLIFSLYCAVAMTIKYILLTIVGENYIEGISIIFYYLTTILIYPLSHLILNRIIHIEG